MLQIIGHGAVDPREDAAVHGRPCGALGVGVIREHVILEIVLAEDDEEEGVLVAIVVGWLLQGHENQDLDVDDGDGLRV